MPPATPKEPTITVDRDAAVAEGRRNEALQQEVSLAQAEIERRQWDKIAKAKPKDVVDAPAQLQSTTRRVEDIKGHVGKMHALAGTSRADAKQNVLAALRSQRLTYERAYLRAVDAEQHPEAYPPQMNNAPAVWTAAIEATDEVIAEAEKW